MMNSYHNDDRIKFHFPKFKTFFENTPENGLASKAFANALIMGLHQLLLLLGASLLNRIVCLLYSRGAPKYGFKPGTIFKYTYLTEQSFYE